MSDPTISVNLTVTAAGAQQTPPLTLWANLITLVASVNPGYTVLPGGLIEDLASTATYAIALIDSAAVETINSLTPFAANPYILNELGAIYGVQHGVTANTSVYVVFSGTPGIQIPLGFLVTDGNYQYQVQDGGAIGSGGQSPPLFCVATQSGSWAVPAGTVNGFVSSKPPGVVLTCTNPLNGTPSAGAQTPEEYAAQVLQAGLVSGQGSASMAKTLLAEVAGVQSRLVSCKQVNGGGWEVICGGGDPYSIANAIYSSGLDISTLVGSTIGITSATLTNPCVITTNLFHGFTNGQSGVVISGAQGLTGIDGTWTVTTTVGGGITNPNNQFSIAYDATGGPAYTGGGVVTPNARNVVVNLDDYPDTYTVPFVNPPAQTVSIQLTWNTVSLNFVSDSAVSQLGTTALVNYVNSIPVGAPINLYAAEAAFVAAVLPLFNNNAALISSMVWTVSINGVDTPPVSGTFLVYGDPESYFTLVASAVTITQG